MKRTISTIGYEGVTIQEFVTALQRDSVEIIIDVRDVPLSRKKGFSKNQLADSLRAHGIQYVHLKGLGDPKDGREAARAGNYPLFAKIFAKHMRSNVAKEALDHAGMLVSDQHVCLMCFEADYKRCHRTVVASHLAEMTGCKVTPLAVRDYTKGRIAA